MILFYYNSGNLAICKKLQWDMKSKVSHGNKISSLINRWQINQPKQYKKAIINYDECVGVHCLDNCSFGLSLPFKIRFNLALH